MELGLTDCAQDGIADAIGHAHVVGQGRYLFEPVYGDGAGEVRKIGAPLVVAVADEHVLIPAVDRGRT